MRDRECIKNLLKEQNSGDVHPIAPNWLNFIHVIKCGFYVFFVLYIHI